MRVKTNRLAVIGKEELEKLVSQEENMIGLLRNLGLNSGSYNYRLLKDRCEKFGISLDNLKGKWRKDFIEKLNDRRRKPLNELLVVGGGNKRGYLKRRLIREGKLSNSCSICEQKSEWNGKPLMLVLDHINGTSNDNRLVNLRLLCPNCNSQTDTFAGRNYHRPARVKRCICGTEISRYSERCPRCSHQLHRKAERPDLLILRKDTDELGFEATGRKYGVSGNAIRKWFLEVKKMRL